MSVVLFVRSALSGLNWIDKAEKRYEKIERVAEINNWSEDLWMRWWSTEFVRQRADQGIRDIPAQRPLPRGIYHNVSNWYFGDTRWMFDPVDDWNYSS